MLGVHNKVVLYARFSSDNQRSESIDAQVRAMKAYCEQKSLIIVDIYVDEAKSATTDQRPSFQRMIADSKHHTFDAVLVHKLDRFARNRYDSAVYKRELKKNGVSVYSVLERLDDSPESIMMESVLEGMNEYYSQNLAREVMKGLRETAMQCKHTGGKPPLGYDVDPVSKKLVINPVEAEAVRCIFSMYAEGHGYTEILDTLHSRGYKTKSGNEFMKNSLYSILSNPKYQGMYVFNRSSAKSVAGTRNTHLLKSDEHIITVDGGCPKIVDKATFEKVQERVVANRRKGGRQNALIPYLLSGKIYCSDCGRAMVGNSRRGGRNKVRYTTYRCPKSKYSCANSEISQEKLEQYTIDLLEQHIFNSKYMAKITKEIEQLGVKQEEILNDEKLELQSKITETEEAISNIAQVIMSGLHSKTLIEKLTDLETEKTLLEAEILKLDYRTVCVDEESLSPGNILNTYNDLRLRPANPAFKYFIHDFIERIEVGRYSVTFVLRTGLGIFPRLDTTLTVRRQEIYEHKKIAG